jgi:hypothetical protein
MLHRYLLLSLLLVGLIVTPIILHAQEKIKPERAFHTMENTYTISLDSRDSTNNEETINLSDFNYPAPPECAEDDKVCFETSIITINVEKTWEIATVLPIYDPELEADIFAAAYPGIEQLEWDDLKNSPDQIMIAQRTLYERGLLDVLPTGQYGYLTEEAVLYFQALKGIQEFDHTTGQAIIGPQTITELNGLKDRMQKENYFEENPLPVRYDDVFTPQIKRRLGELAENMKSYEPSSEQKEQVDQNKQGSEGLQTKDDSLTGSQLQYYGNATIQK